MRPNPLIATRVAMSENYLNRALSITKSPILFIHHPPRHRPKIPRWINAIGSLIRRKSSLRCRTEGGGLLSGRTGTNNGDRVAMGVKELLKGADISAD